VPKINLTATLSALADRKRRAVIDLLKKQPLRAGEIAGALALTPPALSRHLRVLRRSGLIHERRVDADARVRVYRLRKEPFHQLQCWLQDVEAFWTGELASFSDLVDQRAKTRRKVPAK
jgi:DNA-binding transcriptional ArsR family regulator